MNLWTFWKISTAEDQVLSDENINSTSDTAEGSKDAELDTDTQGSWFSLVMQSSCLMIS